MTSNAICPSCRMTNLRPLADNVRFGNRANVYRCLDCDLTFLDQKSFKFPKDFYEGQYHQTYITHVEPDALDPQKYYEKMKKANAIWADRFRAMLTGREVVLDVGCSTGHFIDMIREKTARTYGCELNRKEIEFCRNILKLDVSAEPVERRFQPGTFDFITMIYVLEHIAEPKEFLEKLNSLLKPEGKLVILVPNAQDALVNFFDIPEFRAFYYCIEHLFYYTPKTLNLLLDKAGLKGETETIQEYPIVNHLNWAYRRGPSDVLASRRGVPDVPLAEGAPQEAWENLWMNFNGQYQAFLKANGYGDRIWCVAGKHS